jgi:hypothetical protein
LAVNVPVDSEPLTVFAPAHAPDAAQALALVEFQESCAAVPETTLVGVALSVTVGAGGAVGGVAGGSPPPLEHADANAITAAGDHNRICRKLGMDERAGEKANNMNVNPDPWLGRAIIDRSR